MQNGHSFLCGDVKKTTFVMKVRFLLYSFTAKNQTKDLNRL